MRKSCRHFYYAEIRAYFGADCGWINKAVDKKKFLILQKVLGLEESSSANI